MTLDSPVWLGEQLLKDCASGTCILDERTSGRFAAEVHLLNFFPSIISQHIHTPCRGLSGQPVVPDRSARIDGDFPMDFSHIDIAPPLSFFDWILTRI